MLPFNLLFIRIYEWYDFGNIKKQWKLSSIHFHQLSRKCSIYHRKRTIQNAAFLDIQLLVILTKKYKIWNGGLIIQKTTNDLFTKLKDRTPPNKQSRILYSIPYSCGKFNIDQSKNRVKQHQYDCREDPLNE